MPATRHAASPAPLIAGCLALALGARLPLLTQGRKVCGWTCYSPLHLGPSPRRVVTATDLWHLRPAFAIAIAIIALLGALAGWSGRGRRTAALLIALSVIALVVDAQRVDGVDALHVYVADAVGTEGIQATYAASPSPWVIVPVLGGLVAIASLLAAVRRGRLSPR